MGISRKKFLGVLGAAGASLTVPKSIRAMQEFKGHPDGFGVLHDTTRCTGCRSCEAACNEVNKLPAPKTPFKDTQVLAQKRRTDYKTFTVVNKYEVEKAAADGSKKLITAYRKSQCSHCMEPACASACFVSAFTKTPKGPVDYDPDLCVGCRYCMLACPFYIPAYEYHEWNPRMHKCTMCLPRLKEGKRPGCVDTCPVDALTFGKRTDLIEIAHERIKKHPERYINQVYGEHEMGGTSWIYLAEVPFDKLGLPKLGTTPHAEYTHGALSAVPVVVPLWLAFLTGVYAINDTKDKESSAEKKEAVAGAITETKNEEAKKAADAAERFKREKDKAVETAVKKALSEQTKPEEKS
ncbi:MAG: sulfate respiration complex iron-sulfur protein HmcB [Elusimicrobiota bacterium]